jgi:hypothetical protein
VCIKISTFNLLLQENAMQFQEIRGIFHNLIQRRQAMYRVVKLFPTCFIAVLAETFLAVMSGKVKSVV